jgi:hypothetical protein
LLHELHGCSAAAGRADRRQRPSGLLGHLLAPDVWLDAVRLAKDARVNDDRLGAEGTEPVADVRDLLPLRVEGADQRYARGMSSGFGQAALPTFAAPMCWRSTSIESCTYWS